MERKQTQGRKKIEMKMIANENARRITFSKRRHGLFKKASELSTLCGVDMAIVLFSMGGKAFSFGKPNVDSIVDRFLNQNAQPSEGVSSHATRHYDATVHQLNQQFHDLRKRLEAEKKKEKIVQNMSNNNHDLLSCRFDAYVNQLDLQQLEQLKKSMEELKKNVAQRVDELNSEGSSKHAQEEEQVENTEINDNDVSTIPHDWLRL
ncbi:agamous-like MADS-box protein AGL62 [Camellia sinensis]|uniref:MADS-box domain-containing protein n=1 Tax=Camellia sinensis var. sinensis TaxID=542762 RepID=A0A4S4EMB6_CAMSN|nr:agamous-like MADS-box protein AGL62 [Camellia sinensis]THG17790.1 hypothetical protein TEA_022598 [Camellia sinensis var. sinensis]